jgi:hypothetical protein
MCWSCWPTSPTLAVSNPYLLAISYMEDSSALLLLTSHYV